jgi:lipopolysaccharide biosynthesis regulator YciM
MADDSNNNDADIVIPNPDAGGGFKFEMAAMNLLLGHWQKILAVVIVLLIFVGAFGQYENSVRDEQRLAHRTSSELRASLESSLLASTDQATKLQAEAYGVTLESLLFLTAEPSDEQKDIIKSSADQFVAHANTTSGVASIDAHLTAADLYRRIGETDAQKSSLSLAIEEAEGAVLVGATVALASIAINAGNTDEGIALIQALTDDSDTFVAQTATLELARMQTEAGKTAEATTAYAGFLSRWPNSSQITAVNELMTALPAGDTE